MYVTMLGISGSGKTSYMSGLYESLGAELLAGFRIEPNARGSDSGDDLLALGDFESISFSGQKYKFPSSTQKTTLWSFDLLHDKSLVGNFHWIDYRGGILTDSPDEIRSSERKMDELRELTAHVQLTNAILIFIDSIALTFYEEIKQARRETGVDKITSLMLQIDRNHPNRNLTYVIILTKADAVDEKWKSNGYGPLMDMGLKAFDKFVDYAKGKPNWTGGIVPVSAVGEGRVKTTKTPPENLHSPLKVDNILTKFPEPLNVGNSLFFALGQTLKRNREMAMLEIAQQQAFKIDLLKKSNLASLIWRFITRQPTPEKVLQTIEEQQEAYRVRLAKYDKFIEPLLASAYKSVRIIQGW